MVEANRCEHGAVREPDVVIAYGRTVSGRPGQTAEEQLKRMHVIVARNYSAAVQFVTFQDEKVPEDQPWPEGLVLALDESRRCGPGIFMIENLGILGPIKTSGFAIAGDLMKRRWRFIAFGNGIDTAIETGRDWFMRQLLDATIDESMADFNL